MVSRFALSLRITDAFCPAACWFIAPKGQLLPYPEIKKSKQFYEKRMNAKTSPVLFENFENNAPNWTESGSWQVGIPILRSEFWIYFRKLCSHKPFRNISGLC